MFSQKAFRLGKPKGRVHMNDEAILQSYCEGCSHGYPKARFVRSDGDRYVHMAGMTNRQGQRLEVTIVCTAVEAFWIKDIKEETYEIRRRALSESISQLPLESGDKDSIEVKPHFFGEYVNGRHETTVSLASGPQLP